MTLTMRALALSLPRPSKFRVSQKPHQSLFIVDFKSLFNARFRSSLQTSKFGNWARTSQQSSQVHFRMFELRLQTNVHTQ
jgi:hypothetical protein